MPTLLGPSHYIFYAAMHRRRIWLDHLSTAFEPYAQATWKKSKQNLDTSFARMFTRLSSAGHLGILAPLPLHLVIDDTPIDSFLMNLSDDLSAYEQHLFAGMHEQAWNPAWIEELSHVSMLWGRELAQECLMARRAGGAGRSLSCANIFELFTAILQGGDFSWKPLLLRRSTADELQYELRRCPHRTPGNQSAAYACRLDAMVHRGFVQALVPNVHFERLSKGTYCVDELSLR